MSAGEAVPPPPVPVGGEDGPRREERRRILSLPPSYPAVVFLTAARPAWAPAERAAVGFGEEFVLSPPVPQAAAEGGGGGRGDGGGRGETCRRRGSNPRPPEGRCPPGGPGGGPGSSAASLHTGADGRQLLIV